MNIFHIAIPTHDLDASDRFYTSVLGARRARRYNDRVTFCFFEHQLVCHLAPDKIDREIKMYPRHFGITFTSQEDFSDLYDRSRRSGYPFFEDRFVRWPERPERHESFFIADPSNNLIEFKYYYEHKYIY